MKKSVAYEHFPEVVNQNNRFWLYNPVLKKRYENRPEERVRLKWVEYLLHQTKWKKSRIGFETPVKLCQSRNTLRADLVLYSDSMTSDTLIECKSETVKLNQAVAVQAARYNRKVNASHLILTNGIEDYWFDQTGESIEEGTNFFDEKFNFQNLERDGKYWYKRGFCSKEIYSELANWLIEILNSFWSNGLEGKRLYLDFKQTLLPVPMNQYYKLFEIDSGRRIAISFTGTTTLNTHLIGILNVQGVNRAVLSVDLDKLFSGNEEAIHLFKSGEKANVTSAKTTEEALIYLDPARVDQLPEIVMNFFD
jgi:hypothetical protein